jgi:hypothetical protein
MQLIFFYLFRNLTSTLLLILTALRSTKPPDANTTTHAPPPSQYIQCFPLYTLPGSLVSFKSFFMTSSHPRRGRPAFCLALDGWRKRAVFGNIPWRFILIPLAFSDTQNKMHFGLCWNHVGLPAPLKESYKYLKDKIFIFTFIYFSIMLLNILILATIFLFDTFKRC